ncbi:MAG: hypothetical protein AAF628_17465 [Planctomycetota bacterium]
MAARNTIIIELEDHSLRLLVAQANRRRTRVVRVAEPLLVNTSPSGLVDALAPSCASFIGSGTHVVVMLGDRRIVPGAITLPGRARGAELRPALEREARRAGMFSDHEELVLGWKRIPGEGDTRVSFEVAPRRIVADVLSSLRDAGLDRVWLTSIETVFAAALSTGPAAVGLLDLRGARARLVLAQHGTALAVRKFKLLAPIEEVAEKDNQVLLPLAAEIHRSLDLFGDQCLPTPTQILLLGTAADGSVISAALDEMTEVAVAEADHPCLSLLQRSDDDPQAWLGPASLVHSGPSIELPWLAEPQRSAQPKRSTTLLSQAVGWLALAGGAVLGAPTLGEEAERAAELARLQDDVARLELDLEERRRLLAPPQIVRERQQILHELDRGRVAVSHLLSVLAHSRPPGTRLTEVRVKDGAIDLQGILEAEVATSRAAMRTCSDLSASLGSVPGVRATDLKLAEFDATQSVRPFRCSAALDEERR